MEQPPSQPHTLPHTSSRLPLEKRGQPEKVQTVSRLNDHSLLPLLASAVTLRHGAAITADAHRLQDMVSQMCHQAEACFATSNEVSRDKQGVDAASNVSGNLMHPVIINSLQYTCEQTNKTIQAALVLSMLHVLDIKEQQECMDRDIDRLLAAANDEFERIISDSLQNQHVQSAFTSSSSLSYNVDIALATEGEQGKGGRKRRAEHLNDSMSTMSSQSSLSTLPEYSQPLHPINILPAPDHQLSDEVPSQTFQSVNIREQNPSYIDIQTYAPSTTPVHSQLVQVLHSNVQPQLYAYSPAYLTSPQPFADVPLQWLSSVPTTVSTHQPPTSVSTNFLMSNHVDWCSPPFPYLLHSISTFDTQELSPLNTPMTISPLEDKTHGMRAHKRLKRLKRSNHPTHVCQILRDWIVEHVDDPYPNEDQKRILCNLTDLTREQIDHWFINTRRRVLKKQSLPSTDTTLTADMYTMLNTTSNLNNSMLNDSTSSLGDSIISVLTDVVKI